MTAADRVLVEEELRELREMLALAVKDERPEHFRKLLRVRIADLELELAR